MLGLAARWDFKGTPGIGLISCFLPRNTKDRSEVLIETFIRKQLRLKAHTVTKVEEADDCLHAGVHRPAGQSTVALRRLR